MSSVVPFDDARALLTAANIGYPIKWPNEPWSNPNPPTLWVDFEMTGDTLDPIEMNGGSWQEDGRLFCHIQAPIGTGSRNARMLAKTIANVYRGLGARAVMYFNASIGNGLVEDASGAWWTLSLSVQYRYQDVANLAPY